MLTILALLLAGHGLITTMIGVTGLSFAQREVSRQRRAVSWWTVGGDESVCA